MKMLLLAAAIIASTPAIAADSPPAVAPSAPVLSLRECLDILGALQSLDGRRTVIGQSVEVVPYKFGVTPERNAAIRDAISHDIYVLTLIQGEARAAASRIQMEIGKGEQIVPGTADAIKLDARYNEYLARPCKADLDHIRDEDLRIGDNDIPGSVLGILYKIRDRK